MFSNLIDQVVCVKVGGCEYYGTISRVGEDFLMVDDETAGVVILPFEHLKSLSFGEIESVRTTVSPIIPSGLPVFDGAVLPNDFRALLEKLRQTIIRIEGGGVNLKLVLLLDVLADYVVLCTVPEGITYMPVRHILAMAPVDAYIQPEFSTWMKEYSSHVVHATCMNDLLKMHIGKSIQLSRDSPEEMSGILCSVDEHYAELVTSPITRVYVPMHHIKRIDTFQRVEWVPSKNG
jgi:hypothetical protein